MEKEKMTDNQGKVRMHKAYKFRIFPNEEQKVLLSKTFGSVHLVYNHYLDKKIKTWQNDKISLTYSHLAKDLVSYKEERPFLREVDSIALQQSLRHLDTAYQNFFRDGKVGFPRFKSKKQHHDSYTSVSVNNNIRLEAGAIILPKLKAVKIKQHRPIPDSCLLKSATISRKPTDQYYVSILYAYEIEIKMKAPIKTIGLDFLVGLRMRVI